MLRPRLRLKPGRNVSSLHFPNIFARTMRRIPSKTSPTESWSTIWPELQKQAGSPGSLLYQRTRPDIIWPKSGTFSVEANSGEVIEVSIGAGRQIDQSV